MAEVSFNVTLDGTLMFESRLKLLWTRLPRSNFGKNIFSNNLINSAYEVWKAVCGREKRPALVAKGPSQKIRLMEFLN